MVTQSPALLEQSKVYEPQKRIVFYQPQLDGPPLLSFYCAISAEAYTKDGLNAHGIIYDELHAAPNRELWDVLKTSQGARRQPATVVTTTAGYDRNSICWELHDYARKIKEGIISDPTWLVVIYAADEKDDWTSEDVWRKCNPALGTFRNIDEMRSECKRAQETPAYEMTFRRLYLNQWVNSVERWMPMDKWDTCGGKIDLEALRGRPCYAGLDLSSNIDLTALCLVFPMGEGRYNVLPFFWIPEDTARERERRDRVPYQFWERQGFVKYSRGNVIDYRFILQELLSLRTQYDIREIAFDPWNNSQIAQDMKDDGFTVIDFRQGMRSMSGPTKDLMNTVLSGNLQHGGHPVLRWNADNLVVEQDAAGNLKPDKAKATQKIDGMVALIMGLDRAIRHSSDNGPSIYESEGLKVI
jgi:phage terminase large subunit-like protein